MKNVFHYLNIGLLLIFAVGCGNNFSVTGKVSFPDGSPLDRGTVYFENDKLLASGHIQKNGSYSLGSGEQKGIPAGTYRVSIGGLTQPTMTAVPPADGKGPPKMVMTPGVSPIDKKFHSSDTSGLTCEVKGNTKYDIMVEPPE